ncbi:DUF5324 family protein [Streptomyces calidiresistens]|uniref:Transcriptional regulator n=1 Tax=Streptomyces calidiresistens TaxID=1485586 RepID=A0A7W3XXH2_9ACTN|nr:DUF5324 family protein [Streptomyces calidiresistens]MBB0231095.1 transcriptional regulator [Streptomyces calidiresistens]
MNRNGRVRAAGDHAKETARHAAEVVGPYAASARENARHYAHETGTYLAPRTRKAVREAEKNYRKHVAPHVDRARRSLPDGVDEVAHRAADGTRRAAHRAAEGARHAKAAAAPRIEAARAHAGPVGEEVAARSAAAVAALRGAVSPAEIRRAVRRRERRARTRRAVKWVGLTGLVVGGAWAAWRWWDQQTNPDWLVEPPAPTELGEDVLDEPAVLDPEVEAKQAEADVTGDTREGEGSPEDRG